jgi:FkbM family methyltransferase
MWVYVGSTAATKVIYGSPPDWPEMQAWKRLLGPGDLFIDVGANVGVYSLWAADLGARVIAVEPDPIAANRLRVNVGLNPGVDVAVVEAAAAERVGMTTLTVGLDAENRLGGERQIRAITLDSIAGSEPVVHGVKIDVEGAERLVLEGARGLLAAGAVRVLQLEWNSASEALLGEDRTAVANLLREQGYRFCRPNTQGRLHLIGPEGYGPDVFAIHEASLSSVS